MRPAICLPQKTTDMGPRRRRRRAHEGKEGGDDEQFVRLAQARDVLTDPAKRERYDELLRRGISVDYTEPPHPQQRGRGRRWEFQRSNNGNHQRFYYYRR